MNQSSFKERGTIAANISMTQPKGVEVKKYIEQIRSYVDTMHRAGRKIEVIRIKRNEWVKILDALNKGRKDPDPDYSSMNWDGIPVIS